MKRPLLIAITAGILLAATSCGSDPAPSPTLGSGSEVDRSSAEATAVAFANIYATGDVPAACELATDEGKQSIGSACQRKQEWSTSVTLTGDCEKAIGTAGSRTFFFDAPEGSLNRNSRLEVDVAPGPDSMWFVTAAVTPADGGGSSPCAPSSATSSSSAGVSSPGGG